jgi:ATP-binding cassette subfamily B protein
VKLQDPLPRGVREALAAAIRPDETVRFTLRSDLTLDRRYGESYIAATDARLAVFSREKLERTFPYAELKEVKVDELFGSGRLLAVTAEGERNLLFYSRVLVPEFGVFCRAVNDLLHKRRPELPAEDHPPYCPKCGAALPERGGHCPLCVPRLRILARLMSLMKPYRGRAVLLALATVLTVGSQTAMPYLTKLIVDDVIQKHNHERLLLWVGLMVACGTVLLAVRLVGGALTAWLGARIAADLRSQLHRTVQRLRMSYFHKRESGEIVGRVMHDTSELQHFLIEGIPYFLVQCGSLVAIATVLLCLDAGLAILVFLPVPFLVFGGGWFWRRLIPLFHKHGSRIGALHSVLNETVQGIKAIKAFSGERQRIDEFDGINVDLFGVRYRVDRTFTGFFEVMFWIMSVGIAAVWYFAARRIAAADPADPLTLGDLLAFVGYMWMFYGPMQWFTTMLNWMTHAFSGAERIFAVLDSPEEVYDAPGTVAIPRIRGEICFQDVRFSYERGKEVVKGVTFEIHAGEMIGLVGKSGAGKSTVINLICRFYDVDAGAITIDGQPIQTLKLESLRRQIGMVMQEPFLFNASILDNISYGVPDVKFEEVLGAARAANAHDFVLDKEDGYDTVIGERGATLSGGERQRIAIARAILHNPSILILDEATSSVDTETEKAIQEAITNLVKGRTTIAIAHRLSTLRNAHRLIVVDDGKIEEVGTHEELLRKNGVYTKLVETQTELSRIRGEVWKE